MPKVLLFRKHYMWLSTCKSIGFLVQQLLQKISLEVPVVQSMKLMFKVRYVEITSYFANHGHLGREGLSRVDNSLLSLDNLSKGETRLSGRLIMKRLILEIEMEKILGDLQGSVMTYRLL